MLVLCLLLQTRHLLWHTVYRKIDLSTGILSLLSHPWHAGLLAYLLLLSQLLKPCSLLHHFVLLSLQTLVLTEFNLIELPSVTFFRKINLIFFNPGSVLTELL